MTIETQIATSGEHFQMWKDKALFTNDIYEAKKALERAFFWMELRSAFIFLHTIEKTSGNDRETKDKILKAKINMSRKLSAYAKTLLDEVGQGKR